MVIYPLRRLAEHVVPYPDGIYVVTADSNWEPITLNPATGVIRPYRREDFLNNFNGKPFFYNRELDIAVVWWSHTQELTALFPHGNDNQVIIRTHSRYTLLTVVPDGWQAGRGSLRTAVSLDGLTAAVVIEKVVDHQIFHQLVVFDLP